MLYITLYFILICAYAPFCNGESFNGRVLLTPTSVTFCQSANLDTTNTTADDIYLLKFLLAYPPNLPREWVTVLDSTLYLQIYDVGPSGASGTIHELMPGFNLSETHAWSHFPNNMGPVAGVNYVTEAAGSYSISTDGVVEIDVTDTMKRWLDPDVTKNTGWLIKRNNPHGIIDCGSVYKPRLEITLGSFPVPFTCFTYKDPLGLINYPEPFIAYTRFCAFCAGPDLFKEGFAQLMREMLEESGGNMVLNGIQVATTIVEPIADTGAGFCTSLPPDLNTREVEVSFEAGLVRLAFDTRFEYTTKLPEEIACRSFECSDDQVLINGTFQGEILTGDSIFIRNDVLINGNFSVQGQIKIESTETVLTIEGCVSATNGINIQLDDNETYVEGQQIIELFTPCDIDNTSLILTGGGAERDCAELIAESSLSARRITVSISVDESGCGSTNVGGAKSSFNKNAHIIIPVIVSIAVVITLVLIAAIAVYRYQRFHDIKIPALSSFRDR